MARGLYALRDVEKYFGAHRALRVPALDLESGGVTAIVGPNGSGKTTLLRLLALVDEPTRGRVIFAADRGSTPILYLDQAPLLFRGTVEFNVAYGLAARGIPRPERHQRTAQMLADLGLSGFERRRTSRLSGGERRRVALARTLVLDPSVLLLDEPFAEIDRPHADSLERILAERGKTGTVVLTTHDLAQAHRIAQRIISLVEGEVSTVPLVNIFRGTIAHRDGTLVFRTAHLEFEVAEHRIGASLAAVDPEAVVLSVAPLESSARNRFSGTVARVEERGGRIHLTVDCGEPIVATITRQSYEELTLNVGHPIWVTFKSTAVRLYGSTGSAQPPDSSGFSLG